MCLVFTEAPVWWLVSRRKWSWFNKRDLLKEIFLGKVVAIVSMKAMVYPKFSCRSLDNSHLDFDFSINFISFNLCTFSVITRYFCRYSNNFLWIFKSFAIQLQNNFLPLSNLNILLFFDPRFSRIRLHSRCSRSSLFYIEWNRSWKLVDFVFSIYEFFFNYIDT